MNRLEAIKERLATIPEGVTSDWRGTNHFEIHTAQETFWLDLHEDLEWMFSKPDNWCETDCGKRLGLVMDTFAAYKPDLRDLLAVADAAIGVMCDSSEPVENMSSAGWEGVSLCNYGMLKRLTLALAPLLMEVEG